MDTLPKRLEKIMSDNKLNKKTLGELTGFSDVMVGKYVKGRSLPGFDFIQELVTKIPNINSHWLLTGIGPETNSGDSRLTVLNDYDPLEIVQNIESREVEFKKVDAFIRLVDRVARENGLIEKLIQEVADLRKEFHESQKNN